VLSANFWDSACFGFGGVFGLVRNFCFSGSSGPDTVRLYLYKFSTNSPHVK